MFSKINERLLGSLFVRKTVNFGANFSSPCLVFHSMSAFRSARYLARVFLWLLRNWVLVGCFDSLAEVRTSQMRLQNHESGPVFKPCFSPESNKEKTGKWGDATCRKTVSFIGCRNSNLERDAYFTK